jgi:hypothetical protein
MLLLVQLMLAWDKDGHESADVFDGLVEIWGARKPNARHILWKVGKELLRGFARCILNSMAPVKHS